MGAGVSQLSRPSKISSGDDLLAKTKEVREMSNALFEFMYGVWEDKEIWEIANNPGDYVIAISDLITNQFHVLGYTTKRNQVGEIYFAKYSKLKPPSAEGEKGIVQQRENAQLIAFYFVRIFQILGSLLLVVKDAPIPTYDAQGKLQSLDTTGRPIINQYSLPRFRPISTQYGGATLFPRATPLGPYEFLRNYLRQISDTTVTDYMNKYGVQLDRNKLYQLSQILFFEYVPPESQTEIRSEPDFKYKFVMITKNPTTKRASLTEQPVKVSKLYPNSMPEYIAPGSSKFSSATQQLTRYPQSVTFDLKIGRANPPNATVTRVEVEAKKESYADGAEYAFDSGTNVEILLAQFDAQKDFVKILENLVLLAIRANNNDKSVQALKIESEGEGTKATSAKDIGKLPETIKNPTINEVYQLLKPGTAAPHCIARALQLLDAESIQGYSALSGNKSGKKPLTNICKFAVGDQAGPIRIPEYKPLKTITQLYGKVNPLRFKESQEILSAFVGTSATTTPLGVNKLQEIEQTGEADALQKALEKLSKAFQTITEDNVNKIARPRECKTSDSIELTSSETTLQLQSVAQQLLAYHINNTIEISKFLKVIFNIKQRPNGTWAVEGPKTEILFAGFPVLDQLTNQARELLIDYYSGCEELYQKGVEKWKGTLEPEVAPEAPEVAAPVALAAAPVAPGV